MDRALSSAVSATGLSLFLFVMPAAPAGAADQRPLPTLTRADQVRGLNPEEAARGYPVRLRGVITGDAPAPDFFFQDASAGIFVEGDPQKALRHVLGDLVELRGVTGPGKFAPVVREGDTRVVGRGKLPEASTYSFDDVAAGRLDSQWARIRGMVRSVTIDRTSWREPTLAMNVSSERGQFKVRVPVTGDPDVSSWIGREVLVEGVCGSLFSSERQLVGVLFYVPRLSFIQLESPVEQVPFVSLLRFAPGPPGARRVRVRGAVVHHDPGTAVFLQSEGRGLRVLTQQDASFRPGDVVDALGFSAMGESAPVLEDAVVHAVGREAPPQPIPFDPTVPWERHDGALVSVDAKLLQRRDRPEGLVLQLQSGAFVLDATLRAGTPVGNLASIPLRSDLRVRGIGLVRSGGLWRTPQTVGLLLRSPGDVDVLRAPPWWKDVRTVSWILGMAAATLLIAGAWVAVLGRRLREQMALIRQKLRAGAVLDERNRIARELHDTVEQSLAGITMQLDLAVDRFGQDRDVALRAVGTARKMSRHTMMEARRSVWDLRCDLLEKGDLVSALRELVEPMAIARGAMVDVRVAGRPVRLATPIEMNLLRIAQEAVANAVKHAGAGRVEIVVQYAPGKVSLGVNDDGRGFAVEEASFTGNGHFGLLDMRERARSLGSDLRIRSEHGAGTRLEVEVPVARKDVLDGEGEGDRHPRR